MQKHSRNWLATIFALAASLSLAMVVTACGDDTSGADGGTGDAGAKGDGGTTGDAGGGGGGGGETPKNVKLENGDKTLMVMWDKPMTDGELTLKVWKVKGADGMGMAKPEEDTTLKPVVDKAANKAEIPGVTNGVTYKVSAMIGSGTPAESNENTPFFSASNVELNKRATTAVSCVVLNPATGISAKAWPGATKTDADCAIGFVSDDLLLQAGGFFDGGVKVQKADKWLDDAPTSGYTMTLETDDTKLKPEAAAKAGIWYFEGTKGGKKHYFAVEVASAAAGKLTAKVVRFQSQPDQPNL
ncbi:MAG: hypothetical protein GMKNLPBB_03353 [Myxococcota bacterium]|nr:hypothetical protein [Myxococcota bacterium]